MENPSRIYSYTPRTELWALLRCVGLHSLCMQVFEEEYDGFSVGEAQHTKVQGSPIWHTHSYSPSTAYKTTLFLMIPGQLGGHFTLHPLSNCIDDTPHSTRTDRLLLLLPHAKIAYFHFSVLSSSNHFISLFCKI